MRSAGGTKQCHSQCAFNEITGGIHFQHDIPEKSTSKHSSHNNREYINIIKENPLRAKEPSSMRQSYKSVESDVDYRCYMSCEQRRALVLSTGLYRKELCKCTLSRY